MGAQRADRAAINAPAWLPPLLIVVAFAHNLWLSWLKWGNILVDVGRELELPRRMLAGDRLYADLRFYYGPVAPYLNMVLYWLFGVHVNVLIAAGIVSTALLALAIYRILRRFVAPLEAAVVVVAFLYICAFAHITMNASFNFVLPYSYSATYGMVAAVWSLWFLLRYDTSGRSSDMMVSCIGLLLASLSKVEVLVPAAAVHAVAWVIALLRRRDGWRAQLLALLLTAGAFVGVLALLAWRVGPTLWSDNLASLLNAGSKTYIYSIMGFDDLRGAWHDGGLSAVSFGCTVAVAWSVARIIDRSTWSSMLRLTAVCACGFAVLLMWAELPVTQTFRALPLLMVLVLGGLGYLLLTDVAHRDDWVPHLLVWVFVLGALSRIPLRVTAHHYGFYLLPPGLIGLGLLFFDYLPRAVGVAYWPRLLVSVIGSAYFLGAIVPHTMYSLAQYARHTYEVSTPRGRLLLDESFPAKAVKFLQKFPPGTRVLVIPQGAGLVFFSGLTGADGMFSHLPMEFFGRYDAPGVLARWQANPPDVVVWYRTDMSEFGYQGFGIDYAQECGRWIREHYQPIGTSHSFLRRKPPGA